MLRPPLPGGPATVLTVDDERAIRGKLELDPDRPAILTTEPGVVYRLLAEPALGPITG